MGVARNPAGEHAGPHEQVLLLRGRELVGGRAETMSDRMSDWSSAGVLQGAAPAVVWAENADARLHAGYLPAHVT